MTARPFLRIILVCLLSSSVLAGFPAVSPAVSQEKVFQQGRSSYTGVKDTYLDVENYEKPPQDKKNYGQFEELYLILDGHGNPLIRFNLQSIPSNSTVASAKLWLYNKTPDTNPRRIRAFQVLKDWDAGNQKGSPINAAGKHGATAFYAFKFFPGEGTDVPWSHRGMASGSDYGSTNVAYTDVFGEGWYQWDLTSLVQAWVKSKSPNFGIVLRDGTGYQAGQWSERVFHSSQSPDKKLRPKLTVVFNPDTPVAKPGPDQTNMTWDGAPITLDGSASRDRPGGNDSTLTYLWKVVRAGYGSTMNGLTLSEAKKFSFTPDARGEWDIELTVTNDQGEKGTGTVHLRLLTIPEGHPRIYLNKPKLAELRQRATSDNFRWTQLKARADGGNAEMLELALTSLAAENPSYCRQAISIAVKKIGEPYSWRDIELGGDIALVYDWCYGQLSSEEKTTFLDYQNKWAKNEIDNPSLGDSPDWGDRWPRYGRSLALIGLATYGESPRAAEWLNDFRLRRFEAYEIPLLNKIADGGGWPEGTVYDWIANTIRVQAVEAWRSATGEDLFLSTKWFRERLGYVLLHRFPGIAERDEIKYHPYPSTADSERDWPPFANFERTMALILVQRFSDDPLAQQLQAYLAAGPANSVGPVFYHEEFLWFNPDQPATQPNLTTHLARGVGTLFMRSGWPTGAADTSTGATYMTFQAGDHYAYHQHYDQNSFTLFKNSDLAVDSGVYSREGTSNHDINYYVRTIAHNTLVVYNPAEDFSTARPDAQSNDGGQRSTSPASRAPEGLEYWEQHAVHYTNARIERFEDAARYTYALGDAANAYNNRSYNQTMDTEFSGNVAKVKRFQRELVYLRPEPSKVDDYVVVFDRVGVTQPVFSGENTKLLFHLLGSPKVNGRAKKISPGEVLYKGADLASSSYGKGKLFMKFLLPASHNVRRVGGRGLKSFWVFGENYDWQWDPNEPQPRPTNDLEDMPYGEWRLELEPADTALAHNFLTVLYPTTSDKTAMPDTSLVSGTGVSGAHIADADLNRVALFSSSLSGLAPLGTISYSYKPTATALHFLADLTPGARYSMSSTKSGDTRTVELTPSSTGLQIVSSQGVLNFVLAE